MARRTGNLAHPHGDSRGVGEVSSNKQARRVRIAVGVVPSNLPATGAGDGALGMNHEGSDSASKAPRPIFLNPVYRGEDQGHGQGNICPKLPGKYLAFGTTLPKSVQIG